MKKIKNIFTPYIAGSIVFIMLLMMSFTLSRDNRSNSNDFEVVKNLDVFYTLFKELNLYYVDPIVPGDAIKTGIDAMLKSLDPYTVYIPESKVEDFKFMTTGQYGGIGSVIRKKGDYIMIYQPYENTPAVKSGLIAGDIITEVDGKSIKNMSSENVSELLRGQPGTKVSLKIKRYGEEKPLDIEITREEIKRKSVPYYGVLEDNIGYISLRSFTKTAGEEVKEALLELKSKNNIKSLVLDLRGNPGGLLIEAVKICNLFIPKGELIVSTKGKVAQWDKEYTAFNKAIDSTMQIVVIVNSSSASASEIVAGAIQDLDRGVIIGQRTFGKGLVQTTRELSYNAMLKVTTAKYYIPSGRCIQALDYSHRNEDGSVGSIPDSLISEFKTRNGRKVYDGGGVSPDIDIDQEKLSIITTNLILKDFIFDFANIYKHNNPKIQGIDEFKLTDKEFNEFVEYLNDKDFEYKTKTEQNLEELIEASKDEKYFKDAEKELNILKDKFGHDKEKDLTLNKDEIIEQLTQEIILKYYFEKGAIEFATKNDPELIKAVELLKNKQEYNSILQPQN